MDKSQDMVTLELWESPQNSTSTVIASDQDIDQLKREDTLEADAQFVMSFSARTYDQAMQMYYDYQGWGRYNPFDEEDI